MGEHWRQVGEIAQVLLGNFLLLCLWIVLLTAIEKLLVLVGGADGPVLFDFLSIKKTIEAGELVGLVGLIILSIKDIVKIVRR